MTHAELRKSHDAMARFILHLCKFSDTQFSGRREPAVERHYRRAVRLLKTAGVKYSPPSAKGTE